MRDDQAGPVDRVRRVEGALRALRGYRAEREREHQPVPAELRQAIADLGAIRERITSASRESPARQGQGP